VELLLWNDEYSPILQRQVGVTGTRCEMSGMEGRRMECGGDVRCIEDTKDRPERIYRRDKHCEKKSSTCETGVSLHRITLELP
jgi:hypothetical protein